jgi:hypothetical protein
MKNKANMSIVGKMPKLAMSLDEKYFAKVLKIGECFASENAVAKKKLDFLVENEDEENQN